MIKEESRKREQIQIFIAFSKNDEDYAYKIADTLLTDERRDKNKIGISMSLSPVTSGGSIVESIQSSITASDYVLVLLSPESVKSDWVQFELNTALATEFASRDITVLPIIIKDCFIPGFIADKQFFDLSKNFDEGIEKLKEHLSLVPAIDFSTLDAISFENMVKDILTAHRFKIIDFDVKDKYKTFDIKAIYRRKDPFKINITETWLVMVKYYKKSRPGIREMTSLVTQLVLNPENHIGLIVTNSHLTSPARQWLYEIQKQNRIIIRVLDGTDLKRLLLKKKKLLFKYFRKREEAYE